MDKQHRIFSKSLKEEIVLEIETKKVRVSEISRVYEVSQTSIYRWLYKYGRKYKKGVRMVVEKESESLKRLALEKKIAELERLLGKKQVEIEYLNKVIEEGGTLIGGDLKKKFVTKS